MHKIEFIDVEFKNFLSYGKKSQKITFTPGINLILGMDEERNRSNAAGKSSCLEPIAFALFGKLNRNIKKDQIVNWKNRKNCEVKIRFQKGDDIYTVIRGIKPDKMEIYCNSNLIPPLSDVRLYQKQFETEVLDMDFNTFISIIHTNLNTLTPILKMDTPKKRQFLERIFGLEVYSKINERSNTKIKELTDKIYKLNIEIEFDEKKNNELKSQLYLMNRKLAGITSSKEEIDRIRENIKEIIVTEEDLDLIDNKIRDTRKTVDKKITLRGTIEIALGLNKIKKENIEFKIRDASRGIEKADKYKSLLNDYNILIGKHGTVEVLNAKIALIVSEISIIESEIMELNSEMGKSGGRVIGYLTLKEKLHKDYTDLHDKNICPTCRTVLSTTDILESLTDEMKDLDDRINGEYVIQEGYNDTLSLKCNRKNELKLSFEAFSKIVIEIVNIQNDLVRYEEYKDFTAEMEVLDDSLKTIEKYIEEMEDAIAKIDIEILEDKELLKILDIEYDKTIKSLKLLGELQTKLQVLEEKMKQEDNAINEILEAINVLETDIDNLSKKIKEDTAKVAKLQDVVDYLEYIKTICKDDNVKQFAISSIMPFLTRQVNHYLAEGGCNFYLKFSGWLDEEICGPGITNCSYGNLSGGEMRSIDLALQLSFLDIIRLQAAIFPDIIIFDEILDSSIDATGLANLLKIIRAKQKEENSKIFLITHRQEVSDLDIDTTIMVNKIDGYSQLRII